MLTRCLDRSRLCPGLSYPRSISKVMLYVVPPWQLPPFSMFFATLTRVRISPRLVLARRHSSSISKLWSSADDALSDVKSGDVLLCGGIADHVCALTR